MNLINNSLYTFLSHYKELIDSPVLGFVEQIEKTHFCIEFIILELIQKVR